MTKYAEEAGDHDKPRRKLSLFRRCTRFLRPLRFPSSKGRSSIVMSTIGGFAFYLFTLVFPSLNPFVYVNSAGFALSGESSVSAPAEIPIFSADDANRKIIEIQEKMDDEDSNVKHPLDGIKAFSSYSSDDQPDSFKEPAKVIPDPQNIPSSAIQPMAVVAESSSDEPEKNVARKPDPHKIPSSAITPMALDVPDRPYPIDADKKEEDEEQPEEGDEKHEENGNRDPPANINLEDLKKEEEDAMAELAEKEAYARKRSKTDIKSKIYSKKRESPDEKDEENGNRDPSANINLEDLKKEEEDAVAELAEKETYVKKRSKTGINSEIYSKKKEYVDDKEANDQAASQHGEEKGKETANVNDEDDHDTDY